MSDAREVAAQLWCLPQHSAKEMDADFAESIAVLIEARETALQAQVAALTEANRQIRAKCEQYWNESRIGMPEVHAVLGYIHRLAGPPAQEAR